MQKSEDGSIVIFCVSACVHGMGLCVAWLSITFVHSARRQSRCRTIVNSYTLIPVYPLD